MSKLTEIFINQRLSNHENKEELLSITKEAEKKLNATWKINSNQNPLRRFIKIVNEADLLAEETKNKVNKIDCKKGCNHCCKSMLIEVKEIEILSIINHIESMNDLQLKSKITESIITSNKTGINNQSCCFLIDDVCSIYEVRPITCRYYYSKSESACLDYLNTRHASGYGIPEIRMIESVVYDVTGQFLKGDKYEINTIFKRYICNPIKVKKSLNEIIKSF